MLYPAKFQENSEFCKPYLERVSSETVILSLNAPAGPKGGKRTRQVEIHPTLKTVLEETKLPTTGYLFSGKCGGCITRQTADAALRKACDLLGFEGYSTHSFRRTALTRLSNAGVPLRVIQEISGHADLGVLQKYLAVSPEQVKNAIANI